MEAELKEALETYRSALAELDGQKDEESLEMRASLEEALAATQEALEALQQAEEGGGDEEEGEGERPAKKARLEGEEEEGAGAGPSSTQDLPFYVPRRHLPADPDFGALAVKYPTLAPYLVHDPRGRNRPTVDFKDSNGSRELTRVLMKEYFGVEWSVPPGQLVPPVPNRTNYVKWIAQLLMIAKPTGTDKVTGMDIGCGANLIYPLIGSAMFGWSFIAVDATSSALESARTILSRNPQLADLIEVREVKPGPGISGGELEAPSEPATPVDQGGVLLPALRPSDPVLAFTMCNPPFFSSIDKAGLNPSTNHEGTAEEMVCPGGEEAFVQRMVEDSARLKDRVYWFTTMVGKKSTLKQTRYQLQQKGVEVIRTTELVQGKTSRWCVAWSYMVHREIGMAPLPDLPGQQEEGAPPGGRADTSGASALLGSSGVNLKGVVPRAAASVLVRERGGRPDAVFSNFVDRMRKFGCEGGEGIAGAFAGQFACSGMQEELGTVPTRFAVSMLQQDKSTFVFDFKLDGAQRGDGRHQRRLGWLTASLSVQR